MEEKNKSSELKEVTKELIGWEDNKIYRTLRGLTVTPGQTIKGYCSDEKQKYLSPIVYFVGATALEAYLASFTGLYDFMMKKNMEGLKQNMSDPAISRIFDPEKVSEKMYSYFSFVTSETGQKILIIPLMLLLTWLFYKKFNRSFKENSWFALFTLGHSTLLAIPLMLVYYFSNNLFWYTGVSLILVFVYWVWASKQFYGIKLGQAIVIRFFMTLVALILLNLITILVMIVIFASAVK